MSCLRVVLQEVKSTNNIRGDGNFHLSMPKTDIGWRLYVKAFGHQEKHSSLNFPEQEKGRGFSSQDLAACLSCKLRIAHEHSFHQFTGASRCSCDPTLSGPIWWYVERSTQHLHISKQQKKLWPRIGLASLVHEFAALQFAKCEASQKLFLLTRFVP